jgi:tellurite resistance protein
MVDLSNVILEGIQHPYKGDRKLDFVLFFYDSNRPVNIKDGRIIAKKENLVHYCSVHKTFSFDEPGYMDEIENIDAAKPLMVEIAMQMAMSDGSLDQSEGDVIKKWIKKEIDLASDSKKENIKKKLNTALESSYKKLSSGENIDLIIDNFSEIASKNIKYQLIEFCLDVLSADGVADEGELQHLEELTAKIGLNFDEVQKMKDKALVKIDTKNIEGGESASDESLLSMKLDLSKDEALIFIKKEYRKWNGRLNTLNAGNERDNAQRMLDALARLRKKYENK